MFKKMLDDNKKTKSYLYIKPMNYLKSLINYQLLIGLIYRLINKKAHLKRFDYYQIYQANPTQSSQPSTNTFLKSSTLII